MADSNSEPKVVAYFVRHGETALNADGKFRGPLDPPLDNSGLADAQSLGQHFSGVELGDAWSSDKDRAKTTATAILQPKGMTFTPDPNLRSWNVGFMAGRVKADHTEDIDYFQRNKDAQIPDGESLNQFRGRVKPAIQRAIHSGISSGKPSITVAHSSILKEVGNVVVGDHNQGNVYPGGALGVTYDGKKLGIKPILKPKKGTAGYGQ